MSNPEPTPKGGQDATQAVTVLPEDAAAALKAAYGDYAQAVTERSNERAKAARKLANIAAAGRKAGWSVRALAEPCGVTPERLRQIIKEHADGKRVNVKFPKHVAPKKPVPRPRIKRAHLTTAQAKELARLAPIARQNTGSRPLTGKGSEFRDASEKFSELIKQHHTSGVTWREMSDATRPWTSWPMDDEMLTAIRIAEERGEPDPYPPTHKVSGLRMRAARHGYGKGAPPSIQPYRRVVIHPVKQAEDETPKKSPKAKTA